MPELKATPRNRLLGLVADALTSGRNFADRAQVPDAVPLVGGQGLGTLLLGQAPEEFNEWSYGNMPLRINPLAGRTASFVPEVKPGRKQQLADAMLAIQSVPGGPKMAAGLLGAADMGAGKAMFIGPSAKTWDKAAAAKAVELEKAGADPRSIWSETGTLRGADGKWRQEIDDSASELLQPSKEAAEWLSDVGPAEYPVGKMSNVIRHPSLANAYPETQEFRATLKKGTGGAYLPTPGPMPDSPPRFVVGTILEGGKHKNPSATKSTALHEIQHAIQQREGFARGGSPNNFAGVDSASQKMLDEINAILNSGKYDMSEYQSLLQRKRDILNNAGSGLSPHEQYRRLAGEAEARATQARMNMTPEERRATFPLDSYDAPANQLIVRFGDDTALAIDRNAKNKLIRDLGVGKATAPYRLGDVTPGQANALAGLVNAKPPATADVMVSPQALRHIYNARIVQDGFTPAQVADVAEKALMPRSRAAMDPASRNQYPALTNARVTDPATGRVYDAVAPLNPTDAAFDLVTLVPDGIHPPKKKPRQR